MSSDRPDAHAHSVHDTAGFATHDTARLLRAVVLACGLLIIIGAAILWPSREGSSADPLGLAADPVAAHVTAVEELPCASDATQRCALITFQLRDGEAEGTLGSMEMSTDSRVGAGDDIQVSVVDLADGGTAYSFYDFERSTPLLVLLVLFVAAVVALGRWRGVGALAGLAASLFVLAWFALPSLVDGNNAVAVAMVTAPISTWLATQVVTSTSGRQRRFEA